MDRHMTVADFIERLKKYPADSKVHIGWLDNCQTDQLYELRITQFKPIPSMNDKGFLVFEPKVQ